MENLDGYLKNVIFGGFVHQNICVHLNFFLNLIAIVYEDKPSPKEMKHQGVGGWKGNKELFIFD